MGVALTVTLDTAQFEERMNGSAREIVLALRRSVDRSARAARKEAIKTLAQDIGRPVADFRDAVPPVKASTQSNLSASWTIKKKALSILKTGSFTPVLSWNRGSFTGSTFRVTGGGSAALNIPKAFIMRAPNGAQLLMVRTGAGRKSIKPVYAELPTTGMSQDDAAAREVWQKVAERELAANVGREVQAALDGASLSPESGSAGE
jgi:hypothetical protein